jgi:hypothetical protein
VLIGGVPLYGDRGFMKQFWASSELQEIFLPGGLKSLATPAAGILVAGLAARLEDALMAEGTSLAPLTESAAGAPAH